MAPPVQIHLQGSGEITPPRNRVPRFRPALKGRVVRTNICDMFALPRRTSCTCAPDFHPPLEGGSKLFFERSEKENFGEG